ncbi:MAG: hypothetical protein HY558_01920, partial [Euryarchaeota archaeon]|nr:hypothetical protein [Euryarchaeota archaeon]
MAETLWGVVGPLRRGLGDYWMAVSDHRLALLRAETFLPIRGGLPAMVMNALLLVGLVLGAWAGSALGGALDGVSGAGSGLGRAAGTTLGLLGGLAVMGTLSVWAEPRREAGGDPLTLLGLDPPGLERALERRRGNRSIPLSDVTGARAYETRQGRFLELRLPGGRWRFQWLLTLPGIGRQSAFLRQTLGGRFESEFPIEG